MFDDKLGIGIVLGSLLHGGQISKGTFNEVYLDKIMEQLGFESRGKLIFKHNGKWTDVDRVYVRGHEAFVLDVKSDSIANNNGLESKLESAKQHAEYMYGELNLKLFYVFFTNEKGKQPPQTATIRKIYHKGFKPISFYDFVKEFDLDSDVEFDKWKGGLRDYLNEKFLELGHVHINKFSQDNGVSIEQAHQMMIEFVDDLFVNIKEEIK